jgi:hypothetical protein
MLKNFSQTASKSNFVLLEDGSGLTLKPDKNRLLEIKEVKTNVGSTVTKMAGSTLPQRDDPTQNFFVELITDVSAPFAYGALASNARLFKVKGNRGGLTSIEASGRGGKAELVVTVHP